MPERRFPAPWTVEEYRGISYIVRDANNFAVAYVYFESEPGWRAAAMTQHHVSTVARLVTAKRQGQLQRTASSVSPLRGL
jgi:hypothetical protein